MMIKHSATKEFFQKIQADIKKHWKRIFDLKNAYLFEFSYNKAIELHLKPDKLGINANQFDLIQNLFLIVKF